MSVSLIIPAFNEQDIIKNNILYAMEFLDNYFDEYEVIVVDDGSTDNTARQARLTNALVISLNENSGKGAAVRHGILNAKYDYIFFTDCDLPYPLDFILEGVYRLSNCDVVCGKRYGDYPFFRKVLSILYTTFVGLILNIKFEDIQCGIKGFTKRAAFDIFSRCQINGFAFDTEGIFIADKLGLNISQIPVSISHRKSTKVNVLVDSLIMLNDLFRIRNSYAKGEYNLRKVFQ